MEEWSEDNVSASSLASPTGLRKRYRANRVAVLRPIPGNRVKSSINRSRGGGTACITTGYKIRNKIEKS
jgi:hypothetical protein